MEEDDEFFPKDYDLEEVFDNQICPLMKTIARICDEYDIPMIAAFQHGCKDETVSMCTIQVLPDERTCDQLIEVSKMFDLYDL